MKNKPPKYVRLGRTEMRLIGEGEGVFSTIDSEHYWRDGGAWGVEFRYDENQDKWLSVCGDMEWIDGIELVPITKKEWQAGNEGYI